jgi:hypothetical protein
LKISHLLVQEFPVAVVHVSSFGTRLRRAFLIR